MSYPSPGPLQLIGPARADTRLNKLRCCEFKGKQASKIESTSLCCISYTVLHVRDQKNEWSVFVE